MSKITAAIICFFIIGLLAYVLFGGEASTGIDQQIIELGKSWAN